MMIQAESRKLSIRVLYIPVGGIGFRVEGQPLKGILAEKNENRRDMIITNLSNYDLLINFEERKDPTVEDFALIVPPGKSFRLGETIGRYPGRVRYYTPMDIDTQQDKATINVTEFTEEDA